MSHEVDAGIYVARASHPIKPLCRLSFDATNDVDIQPAGAAASLAPQPGLLPLSLIFKVSPSSAACCCKTRSSHSRHSFVYALGPLDAFKMTQAAPPNYCELTDPPNRLPRPSLHRRLTQGDRPFSQQMRSSRSQRQPPLNRSAMPTNGTPAPFPTRPELD